MEDRNRTIIGYERIYKIRSTLNIKTVNMSIDLILLNKLTINVNESDYWHM